MNSEFIEALHDIEKEKGVSTEVLLQAIEQALLSAYKKNFKTSQNVRVHIERDSGEVKVFARKEVAEKVEEDDATKISLSEARLINLNYETGDVVEVEITPNNFGRIAAQTAKQVVVQRIREAERNVIFEEFSDRQDDVVTGTIQRLEAGNVFVDLGKTEAILGTSEQIPGEKYKQGERIKTYVLEVKKTPKGPVISLSRTHPGLIKRLFELEVPEIFDGLVEIKSVAREAGSRSKLAVHTTKDNVDPVGSCVGPKGTRVQSVVNELKGEKIDIVRYSINFEDYISNALSPAKVVFIEAVEDKKNATVVVPDYQLSLAIGKEGQNARLAAKLTGWKIDIKSESQYEGNLNVNNTFFPVEDDNDNSHDEGDEEKEE